MAFSIRRVVYYYANVVDQPGESYRLLHALAQLGVNLLALVAVPIGPDRTQMTLFPEDKGKLTEAARNANLLLDGPHTAFLAQGDDHLGAFSEVHEKLAGADVNVFASNGVIDGRGAYGYVIYVRPEDGDRAARALGV
jgi:hypothetical protein